jgi:hypothetical protein
LRTYKRFELHGKATHLSFIQVLRTLGRTQHLLMLLPAPLPQRRPTVQNQIGALKGKVALRAEEAGKLSGNSPRRNRRPLSIAPAAGKQHLSLRWFADHFVSSSVMPTRA